VAQQALHVDPNCNTIGQKQDSREQVASAALIGPHSDEHIDDAIAVEVGFVASGGNREMQPLITSPRLLASVALIDETHELHPGPRATTLGQKHSSLGQLNKADSTKSQAPAQIKVCRSCKCEAKTKFGIESINVRKAN